MDPTAPTSRPWTPRTAPPSAHAYEWVKRVGEGPHIVRIERRVGNAATSFWWDDWTFDVSLHL